MGDKNEQERQKNSRERVMRVQFNAVLKDVTRKGTKIQTDEYLTEGKFPIIDQGNNDIAGYRDDETGLFTDVPAIVFGDHTRIVKYITDPFFLGADGVKVLVPIDRTMNCKYLYYQLLSAKIPDTGYNRHFKWVKELEFQLPSRNEQDDVVKRLDKLCVVISARQQQLAKLDELVKARFVEMFGQYSEDSKLSNVATVSGGLTKNAKRDKLALRMPYLRVANVAFATIDISEMLHIGLTNEELEKTLLQKGDLLFVEGNGSPDQIGRVAIWNDEVTPCVHQNHLIKARFNHEIALPVFAMHYFMSVRGREQIKSKAVSTSGLYTLSVSKISDLLLPVPPLNLQKKFALLVEYTGKIKLFVQKSIEQMEIMKKALMQQYFG